MIVNTVCEDSEIDERSCSVCICCFWRRHHSFHLDVAICHYYDEDTIVSRSQQWPSMYFAIHSVASDAKNKCKSRFWLARSRSPGRRSTVSYCLMDVPWHAWPVESFSQYVADAKLTNVTGNWWMVLGMASTLSDQNQNQFLKSSINFRCFK